MAFAYESEDGEATPEYKIRLMDGLRREIEAGKMNPWCGLCHSTEWISEDQPTKFETMEEARPELERLERAQAALRDMVRTMRR
jgi:hypothetical protein